MSQFFYKLDAAAAMDRRLTSSAKVLLAILTFHAHSQGFCFVGIRRLCREAGLSNRTVMVTVAELESCGYIAVQRQEKGGSNIYTLTGPRDDAAPAAASANPCRKSEEILPQAMKITPPGGEENSTPLCNPEAVKKVVQGGEETATPAVKKVVQGGEETTTQAVKKLHHKRKNYLKELVEEKQAREDYAFRLANASEPAAAAKGAASPPGARSMAGDAEDDEDERPGFYGAVLAAADHKAWARAYPGLDVPGELRRAACWLAANPRRQPKNYRRFLVNWLARANGQGANDGLHRQTTAADLRESAAAAGSDAPARDRQRPGGRTGGRGGPGPVRRVRASAYGVVVNVAAASGNGDNRDRQ